MVNKNIDNEILNYILDSNGKIMSARANERVMKKVGWYDYLMQRYSDNTVGTLTEIFNRLKNGIETAPICKNENCNNVIKFNMNNKEYGNYCCQRCKCTSADVLAKIKENDSKALKEAYKERGDEIKAKRAETLRKKYGEENINSPSAFAYNHVREKLGMKSV